MSLIHDPQRPGALLDWMDTKEPSMSKVWDWLIRGPVRKAATAGLLVTGLVAIAVLWGFDAETGDRILKTWSILGPILVALGALVGTNSTTPVADPVLTPEQLRKAQENVAGKQ